MNAINHRIAAGMSVTGRMTGRIRTITKRLGRFPVSVLELGLRAGAGAVFFKSGLTKLANWDLTLQLFAEEYALPLLPPELAAYLATCAELTCPVLLVLGLGARLGAFALLAMTVVIQIFVYPQSWAEHLLWASAFAYVFTRGAGVLSLDHVIAHYRVQ